MEGKCPGCGQQTFFTKEAQYDGFTKTGEVFKCTLCGHTMETGTEPDMTKLDKPAIFSDEDRSAEIHIDGKGEIQPFCRHCTHYIVNPFTQRCGLHEKEVAAIDTCADWALKEEKKAGDPPI